MNKQQEETLRKALNWEGLDDLYKYQKLNDKQVDRAIEKGEHLKHLYKYQR